MLEHLLGAHRFELMRHDVTDPLTLEVDQESIHLACPGVASSLPAQSRCARSAPAVQGTLNVLDLAREAHARVLIASTSRSPAIPSSTRSVENIPGQHQPDRTRAPATTRASATPRRWRCRTRLSTARRRCASRASSKAPTARACTRTTGAWSRTSSVQALRDEPITVYGAGQQTRSFCFVSDLIEGFVRLMASKHGVDPVNLGNPREITVLELAEMARSLAKSRSEIIRAPLPKGMIRRGASRSITRAQKLLDGWAPRGPGRGPGGDHRRLQAPSGSLSGGPEPLRVLSEDVRRQRALRGRARRRSPGGAVPARRRRRAGCARRRARASRGAARSAPACR